MVKRRRLTFSDVDEDGYCVVEFYGKQYAWYFPNDQNKFNELIDERFYTCEIVHNFEGKAMINFTNNQTNKIELRQEINPLEYKSNIEWVVDK